MLNPSIYMSEEGGVGVGFGSLAGQKLTQLWSQCKCNYTVSSLTLQSDWTRSSRTVLVQPTRLRRD